MDDEREAQVLRDFDCILEELKASCAKFSLDLPPLMQAEATITHSCFTHFNTNQEGNIEAEDPEISKQEAAHHLIEHLVHTENIALLSLKKFRDVEGNCRVPNLAPI